MGKHAKQYFGGIIGASPLVEAGVTGQFMLIGGGGGGSGPAAPGYPGGGGAGGVVYGSSFSFSTGSYAIVVGDGGASAGYDTYGKLGADTTGFGFTAKGGGGGAGGGTGNGSDERNGGSGAGPNGTSTQDTYSSTANVTGYGNAGGPSASTDLTGGGGGGAGEAGNTDGDGSGGDGLTNSFLNDIQYGEQSGSNYYVAGGGSGGKYGGAQVAGALGGGGDGAVGGATSGAWVDATAGTTGYGSGGGGGNRAGNVNHYKDGEAGGKGVALVWLPQSYSLGSDYTGSATTSAKTVGGVAGTLITFTTSGTWSPTLVAGPAPDGLTAATAATSAEQILLDYPSSGDGVYWINDGGTPKQVYCDMTTDGGGWMLYSSFASDNPLNSTSYPAWNGNQLLYPDVTGATYGYASIGDAITNWHDGTNANLSTYTRQAQHLAVYASSTPVGGIGATTWHGPSSISELRIAWGRGSSSYAGGNNTLEINGSQVDSIAGSVSKVASYSFNPAGSSAPYFGVKETSIVGISYVYMR